LLTHHEILRHVSLIFLTDSFASSVWSYSQAFHALDFANPLFHRARTDAPMLVSYFKYAISFWPVEVLRMIGNLAHYRIHEYGGYFASVENPQGLVEDLREIRRFWVV